MTGDALETIKEINANFFGEVDGLDGTKKDVTFEASKIQSWSAANNWTKKNTKVEN